MKDYYRYFYEEKVPLSQSSLKKYDKYPVPKRRQCEMYLNSIKYSQPQQHSTATDLGDNANANLGEYQQQRMRNFPISFQEFAKEQQQQHQQQQQSPDLVIPSFVSRLEMIPSNVSLVATAQDPISFEDERQLLHSYSDKRNNNNNNNDEVDITVKCGDQPMDLTVPYPTYTDAQAGIFEKLPPDLEAPRSETDEEEVLDLSMKTSKPVGVVMDVDHPEFYNVHDLSHRASSFLERHLPPLPREAVVDPEMGSPEFTAANKRWNWFVPPGSSSSSSYSNEDPRESGQQPLLPNRNSVSLCLHPLLLTVE